PGTISPSAILDPSVAIASDNTVYLFFAGRTDADSADSHIYSSVSHDRGVTWTTPIDIGASQGIVNGVFPTGVAGDPSRAACAFIGTTTAGDHHASKATIARQSGGKGLLSQFDPNPAEPTLPQPACLAGTRDDLASYLTWTAPDTGGTPIVSYKIYRSTSTPGSEIQIGQAAGNKT